MELMSLTIQELLKCNAATYICYSCVWQVKLTAVKELISTSASLHINSGGKAIWTVYA